MKNWSVSFKLLCLVTVAILAFVGMGLYGISNTGSTFQSVKDVKSTADDFQKSSQEISDPLHRVRELTLEIVLAPDEALRESLDAAQAEKASQLDENLQRWPAERMSPTERAAFEKLRRGWEDYKKLKTFTVDRALAGYREEAFINATGAASRQFDLTIARLEAWQMVKAKSARAVYRNAEAQFSRAVWTSWLVTAVTALFVGVLAFYIVRTIAGPLGILTATASRITEKVDDAEAEAALKPIISSGGEVGHLARAFWRMVDTLRANIRAETQSRTRIDEILKSTRVAVSQLGGTSAQLLASTTAQAAGAERQAEAVTRIATTVEEVTQATREAARRATGVGKTVQHTLEIGSAGRSAVADSISALHGVRQQVELTAQNMMELVQQTQAISAIITAVDDIARQSHLLAVNAAVQAAKAGRGGKEFTVIAGEIKALSEHSRQGTAQVRRILSEILKATGAAVSSMERVTKGVSGAIELENQSSQTINELAAALSEVAASSAETIISAEQEASGMTQINEAMRNIDHVAKQSLLSIQGTAEAARQLNELGSQLTRLSAE